MDISQLDYSAKAEEGRFVQFRHAMTGDLMFDGETAIGAMVRPLFAKSVMAAITSRERAGLTGDDAPGARERVVWDAAVATSRLVGITKGGRELTPGEFHEFYDRTFVFVPDATIPNGFAFQVSKAAQEYADFLTLA